MRNTNLLNKELVELYKKGKNDPVFFVHNIIGRTELWSKQQEILYSIRDNTRTAVRSCNGAGKTYTAAVAVAWFLTTHPNSIVISTAPTGRQVKELLWQEINSLYATSMYPLGGRILQTSWTMGAKWFALGVSTDDPDRFQGYHAENILGVIDEGAGVDAPIYEAMDAILTSQGARLLIIGNPTESSGRFFDAFSSPLYNKIHISAFDTPNFQNKGIIYPALITPQWVEERKQEWGEDSPAYQARILGEFPFNNTDTIIPLNWVMRACERQISCSSEDLCVLAVDIARFGDDETVAALRRGNNLIDKYIIRGADTAQIVQWLKPIIDKEMPNMVVVDTVGVGGGVADILRQDGYINVVDFIAQGKAWEDNRYSNKRAEGWFRLREKFRLNQINLERDEILIGQLTSPKYIFSTKGKYLVEAKKDMKKRGLKSPDRADAVMMAFDCDGTLDSYSNEIPIEKYPKNSVGALLEELIKNSIREEEAVW